MKLFNKHEQNSELYELPYVFTYDHLVNQVSNSNLVPSCKINGILYEAISANSYIKLRTQKGLEYWIEQAKHNRLEPDWKLHFAVAEEDIANAWNIIAYIFLKMRCDYIMKVKTHPPQEWPLHMHGREITVYVPMPSKRLGLSKKNVPSVKFWVGFVENVELQLCAANIQARAIASGDLQLGRYTSIRNEAFILKTTEMIIREDQWEGYDRRLEEINPNAKQYIYPPNEVGYNAANHEEPGFITLIHAKQRTNVL